MADMIISRLSLVKGVGSTIAAFGAIQFLRLVTNVALARLLAPELFGIMAIVNSVRTGIDLISDIGVGQSIVQSRNAEDPDFYNTAWSLQIIRGLLLWIASWFVAIPLAYFYEVPILAVILPAAGLYFVFGGLTSISRFLLQKRLEIRKMNTF